MQSIVVSCRRYLEVADIQRCQHEDGNTSRAGERKACAGGCYATLERTMTKYGVGAWRIKIERRDDLSRGKGG